MAFLDYSGLSRFLDKCKSLFATKTESNKTKTYIVEITASSFPTTYPQSGTDDNITSTMDVIRFEISDPNHINGNITCTTSNGSITLSGATLTSSTTIKLWLSETFT